jgi:hypothetical protein
MKKLINKYIDGEIDENIRSLFDAHIDSCKGCKKEFEETLATVQMVNSISDSELPDGFEALLHEKLIEIKPQTDKQRILFFNRGYVRAMTGIAAGMLVLVFAWGIGGFQNIKNSAANATLVSSEPTDKTGNSTVNKETTDGSKYPAPGYSDQKDLLPNDSESTIRQPDDSIFSRIHPSIKDSGNPTKNPSSGTSSENDGTNNGPDSGVASTNIVCSNVGINITSNDFAGDYEKISNVAKGFNLAVDKDADGNCLTVKMLKTDYYCFKSEIKTAFGESNVSVGAIIDQTSFAGELANNKDYLIVNMYLKK